MSFIRCEYCLNITSNIVIDYTIKNAPANTGIIYERHYFCSGTCIINSKYTNLCITCNSKIPNGFNIDVQSKFKYYCSDTCYYNKTKTCNFCQKVFSINKTETYCNEPYWYCSLKHLSLDIPRCQFGVIGGPVGGPLGRPKALPNKVSKIPYHVLSQMN
jgi:hypothetical protein